jgi:geranylgeranylglycerol-phosphate geranylgeranyltransferase
VGPVLRLVRIGNVLVGFVGTIVGGWAAGGFLPGARFSVLLPLLLAGVSTACVTAGGNVLNDLLDQESDRTNHPDRPLVQGTIRPGTAHALGAGLFVVAVLSVAPQIPTHPAVGAILGAALAAVFGYELYLKASGLAGNLVVALLTGLVFLYGGASVGPWPLVVPFALLAFLATLSREVIKDMEDAAGDVDRRTVPRVYGLGAAGALARTSVAAAIVLSPVPLLYLVALPGTVGIMYIASVVAADGLFVASVLGLPAGLHRAQTLSKVAMTVALVAFFVTALR